MIENLKSFDVVVIELPVIKKGCFLQVVKPEIQEVNLYIFRD